MSQQLLKCASAVEKKKKTNRTRHENMFLKFIYNLDHINCCELQVKICGSSMDNLISRTIYEYYYWRMHQNVEKWHISHWSFTFHKRFPLPNLIACFFYHYYSGTKRAVFQWGRRSCGWCNQRYDMFQMHLPSKYFSFFQRSKMRQLVVRFWKCFSIRIQRIH